MVTDLVSADCGYCGLEGPDEFGNYDLLPLTSCPYHGDADIERCLQCGDPLDLMDGDQRPVWRPDETKPWGLL